MRWAGARPIVEIHEANGKKFRVVRDDLLPGGTKQRIAATVIRSLNKFPTAAVYASPCFGYAQVAVAIASRAIGCRAVIYCPKRSIRHILTERAREYGGEIQEVSPGYMSVVTARARTYAEETPGAVLVPFGLASPSAVTAIAAIASEIEKPCGFWVAVGSGTLLRGLMAAWPGARANGIAVGKDPGVINGASIYRSPVPFEKPAKVRPPYPSSPCYDAKVWEFAIEYGMDGDLIWNVGSA